VAALARAGGFEAADALRPFLEHRSACVRIAAAQAIGTIGVRVRATVAELRDLTTAREADVRQAAHDALGRVGDARDVPALLARLGSEETEVRATALRSLRSITGIRLVGSAPRWERWWRLSSDALPRRLNEAIAAVTVGACEDVAAARETVVRYAWADMDAVEDATRGWLQSSDVRLRAEGARVTTALRLGGLADDVRSVLRYASDPVLFAIAAEAAQAVGAPFDDIRKPVAARK
jgi:HEAT repeat protein